MKIRLPGSVALVTVITLLGLGSCSTNDSSGTQGAGGVTRVAEPGDVINQDLMIALAQAKNFHHKAKVYMSDGKTDDAMAAVRQILSLQFPAGAPEAEDVRLDARAMLAKLLVGKGDLEEAMRVVDEGLVQSKRESFFVANLHTVKGEIHEARATLLVGDGDGEANKAKIIEERREAITAYDRSIKINTALQKQLMEQR
ncbi:MAG: hypothetical protein H0T79_03360 [Deltaproteobacteria bacterium]|nr:hypothetical protein [Deltaproteobacteria bacterium]